MSETTSSTAALVEPSDALPSAAPTPGALLKAARQAAGVHLAVLSRNLKVPVRQLEALERNEYPQGQGLVFMRALASSVCRQLRTDPAPVLALMPHTANCLKPYAAARFDYTAPADLAQMDRPAGGAFRKTGWAILGLLLLIAALLGLPHPTQWSWLDSAKAEAAASPIGLNAVTVPVDALSAAALGSTASPVLVPVVMDALQAPELFLTALETSWVEVHDSQNERLWSGLLKSGETRRVPVLQTVKVMVGRADAVDVVYKGQAIDLKPHAQVNVARFEVQP